MPALRVIRLTSVPIKF